MICWCNKYFAYLLLLAVLLPSAALAADEGFVMIVGVPGLGANNVTDTSAYFAALYNLAIWIAAFLAVVRIMLAGVKYMFTDLVDAKAGAKKDIQGALLGLVIVLAAVLILNTINPDLTNFTLFENVPAPIVNPVTQAPQNTSVLPSNRDTQTVIRINPETGEREIVTVPRGQAPNTVVREVPSIEEVEDRTVENLFNNDFTVNNNTVTDIELERLSRAIPGLTEYNFLEKVGGVTEIETAAIFGGGYGSVEEFSQLVLQPNCPSGRVISSPRSQTTTFYCAK